MKLKKRLLMLMVSVCAITTGQNSLVHPGITHTKSDLDRMKYMVESSKDPWFSTYNLLRVSSDASYNYVVKGNASNTTITNHSDFINDGFAAYHNAIMWYITEDVRHAQKCVDIFNAWSNITRIEDQFALNNGRGPWKMLEGAEIIKHTYSGWSSSDQARFSAMLVYPGWSGTSTPTSAIASKDVTFYWNIYQGDRLRHGNQGLYAYRSLMAMGIFLDNEVMYERALRYLEGQSHRSDDLAYPSGPPNTTALSTGCQYYDEFAVNSHGNTQDYGYNEVLEHYIWESGQSQESSRDQAHGLGGVSAIASICEMAWSQGDNLYGHLNNRLLLGWEFYFRYNLSYVNSYSDQTSPWEPTVQSGEFIERLDRSGRWRSLAINPYLACSTGASFLERGQHLLEPVYEQSLGHYKDRLVLNSNDYKWLERGYTHMVNNIGLEDGRHAVDHAGWGGLKFHRVSPGDPISGFNSSGLPDYNMNVLPMTIEAENFDYFTISGEDRAYNDTSSGNSGNTYRNDENVDIQNRVGGGYNVGWITSGEWLTYTVYVPESGTYDISINCAASNSNGIIKFEFDGSDKTGDVVVSATGGHQTWNDFSVKTGVALTKGVQSMKVLFSGAAHAFNLNSITISENNVSTTSNIALNGVASQSTTAFSGDASRAIDGNTNGAWSQSSVTHTATEANPWWEVDLGSSYAIDNINVFNRTDGCCISRLTNFTVSVINGNSTVFSQSYTSYPNPSITTNANGAVGNIVRVQLNGTNPLSLAEVEVYGIASSVFPDPNKTYYIDAPHHNLRLASDGTSEDAYTTSTNTTGADVEWKFVDRGNGYWHIERAAGGSIPRLRSDATTNADMNPSSSSGNWTFYDFSQGAISGTYFLTLPSGPTAYKRLQIDNTGTVRMVEDTRNGTWESFLITDVSSSSRIDNSKKPIENNLEGFNIYPNPVLDELTIKVNDSYNESSLVILYGVNGQKVMQAELSKELKLDLSKLNDGIYILKVSNKSKSIIKKIVKL